MLSPKELLNLAYEIDVSSVDNMDHLRLCKRISLHFEKYIKENLSYKIAKDVISIMYKNCYIRKINKQYFIYSDLGCKVIFNGEKWASSDYTGFSYSSFEDAIVIVDDKIFNKIPRMPFNKKII